MIKKTDQEPFEFQGRYYQTYETMTRDDWPCRQCETLHGSDLSAMPDKWLEQPLFTDINDSLYCPNCATMYDVNVGIRDEYGDIKKQ